MNSDSSKEMGCAGSIFEAKRLFEVGNWINTKLLGGEGAADAFIGEEKVLSSFPDLNTLIAILLLLILYLVIRRTDFFAPFSTALSCFVPLSER